MNQIESTAEVFLMALKAMPKEQKDTVIRRIAQDKEFHHDLQDLMVFEARKDEPSRPLREFLLTSSNHV